MTDYFPEEDYDPSSGEYTSDFDFDPIFTGRVDLASDIYAEIHSDNPNFEPLAEDLAERLQDLVDHGYFDIEGNRNPLDYDSIENSDFDRQGDSARGPFIDADAVERWLDETGLRDMVDVWYDEDNDEYWIDADTGSTD